MTNNQKKKDAIEKIKEMYFEYIVTVLKDSTDEVAEAIYYSSVEIMKNLGYLTEVEIESMEEEIKRKIQSIRKAIFDDYKETYEKFLEINADNGLDDFKNKVGYSVNEGLSSFMAKWEDEIARQMISPDELLRFARAVGSDTEDNEQIDANEVIVKFELITNSSAMGGLIIVSDLEPEAIVKEILNSVYHQEFSKKSNDENNLDGFESFLKSVVSVKIQVPV